MMTIPDGRQEDVKVFIKKRGGMGPSLQDLAGALLIIFTETNSSVTGSKVGKGFPTKELSGQAVAGFGGGNCFSSGADFLGEVIKKDIQEVFKR